MAITKTTPNHWKYKLLEFVSGHTFKGILTNGLTFNKDSHATLADVSASQISTGNGYTGAITLVLDGSLVENDTDDRGELIFETITVTASGGSIADFDTLIVYDDDMADDAIAGAIELGATISLASGQSYQFTTPTIRAN